MLTNRDLCAAFLLHPWCPTLLQEWDGNVVWSIPKGRGVHPNSTWRSALWSPSPLSWLLFPVELQSLQRSSPNWLVVTLLAPIICLAQQKQNKADPESGNARQSKVLCSAGEVKKLCLGERSNQQQQRENLSFQSPLLRTKEREREPAPVWGTTTSNSQNYTTF